MYEQILLSVLWDNDTNIFEINKSKAEHITKKPQTKNKHISNGSGHLLSSIGKWHCTQYRHLTDNSDETIRSFKYLKINSTAKYPRSWKMAPQEKACFALKSIINKNSVKNSLS